MVKISGEMNFGGVTKQYVDTTFLKLSGGTMTGDLVFGDTYWDDMQFAANPSQKGINDKPDFDYTNVGFLFPQNDQSEYIVLDSQFSHKRKYGTNISPHIHFIQTTSAVPIFVLEYRWYDNGDTVPDWTTIETTGGGVFTYTSGSLLQIISFPDIDGSSINGVSSWFEAKLYRKTGDGITGDVLVKSFDIHYQIDSMGSDDEYIK